MPTTTLFVRSSASGPMIETCVSSGRSQGNLRGDDREGLRALPQPVLPGCTSQARWAEGNTRALTEVASSKRTKPRNRVDFIRSLAVPSVPIHHSAKEPEVGGRRESGALSGGEPAPRTNPGSQAISIVLKHITTKITENVIDVPCSID
jgi:hypothetical protein